MIQAIDTRMRFLKLGQKSRVDVAAPPGRAPAARFTCDFFEVAADVAFAGEKGETGTGYRLGFTQLQWIETSRATYRGLAHGDGRAEVKRDRPPARPGQACRDVQDANDRFGYRPGDRALQGYMPHHPLNLDLGGVTGFPRTITVSHADSPIDAYPLRRTNAQTGKANYLEWAQLEFHFCTVALLQRQDGSLHQLMHFYWNVHWNRNFIIVAGGPDGASVTPAPAAATTNLMRFGPFIPGEVTDSRFGALIAPAYSPTCNDVAANEVANQIVTEAAW